MAGSRRPPARGAKRGYDRVRAESYWGLERRRLKDEFKIVLSAGEPDHVNAAYHLWETMTLVRALHPRRGQRVLDVACGLGRVSAPLALSGATVVGVDNAFLMARAAREKTARGAIRERVKGKAAYVQGFSGARPFPAGPFDPAPSLALLQHPFGAAVERALADTAQGACGATGADHFFYRITRR